MSTVVDDEIEIRVGVLLPEGIDDANSSDFNDTGHQAAFGRRRASTIDQENRVAVVGRNILQAAASAIGNEVGLVVEGVVEGIAKHESSIDRGIIPYEIDNLEMTFGVKVTLGVGKAVEAFLTASTEATMQVKLTLKRSG